MPEEGVPLTALLCVVLCVDRSVLYAGGGGAADGSPVCCVVCRQVSTVCRRRGCR